MTMNNVLVGVASVIIYMVYYIHPTHTHALFFFHFLVHDDEQFVNLRLASEC